MPPLSKRLRRLDRPGFTLIELLMVLTMLLAHSLGAAPTAYEPGKSYFGCSNYVEYIAGDMPLIISAPHGGSLKPSEVPDRKRGEFTPDACTGELARAIQQACYSHFGRCPHVILCLLERRKVDCNREIEEGAGVDMAAR